MFDLDLIKSVYSGLTGKIEKSKKTLNRPMTYAEKILYAHLYENQVLGHLTEELIMSTLHPTE